MTARFDFPRRRVMALWSLFALALISGFYVLVLISIFILVCVPVLWIAYGEGFNPFSITTTFLFMWFVIGVPTAVMVVGAILPRREPFNPPGLLLDRTTVPTLFAEVERVAVGLREQSPSEVYLTADVNAFVTEHGGVMGFRRKRALAVGLPLLSILSISELRAILVHEFGHYYGGDTRLVRLVYGTRRTMTAAREALTSLMPEDKFVLYPRVVWTALLWAMTTYINFFLHVTSDIFRQQEFRCDEIACWVEGPQPLIEGLKRMYASSEAAMRFWEHEVSPILAAGFRPAIADGFALYLRAPDVADLCQKTLEEKLEQSAWNSQTLSIRNVNPADSNHPPLPDRIRQASAMPAHTQVHDQTRSITLLGDVGEAERQLLMTMNPGLRNADLSDVLSWQEVGEQVAIPAWREYIAPIALSLEGMTASSLPCLATFRRKNTISEGRPVVST